MLILFLGTNNCYRTLMSEAMFNHVAPEGFEAISAGTLASDGMHPDALALLEREHICTAGIFNKTWHDLPSPPDLLVTLCGAIDKDSYPLSLRGVAHADWSGSALAEGGASAVDETYALLQARLHAFLALPHEQLMRHPDRLAAVFDDLANVPAN